MLSVPTPALLAHASAIDLHKIEVVAASGYAVLLVMVCTTSNAFFKVLTPLHCRPRILCTIEAKLPYTLPACQASSCNMPLKAALAKAQEPCLISAHGYDGTQLCLQCIAFTHLAELLLEDVAKYTVPAGACFSASTYSRARSSTCTPDVCWVPADASPLSQIMSPPMAAVCFEEAAPLPPKHSRVIRQTSASAPA